MLFVAGLQFDVVVDLCSHHDLVLLVDHLLQF